MNRTTVKDLEVLIKQLNDVTKEEYSLYRAYGGNQLHKSEGAGQTTVSHGGFVTRSQLADQIQTALKVIRGY